MASFRHRKALNKLTSGTWQASTKHVYNCKLVAQNDQESPKLILFNDAALRKAHAKQGDAFELEAKLRPIYQAILSKDTDTPFSVMFSGGWGTGKTSAMRWMDEHLRELGNGEDGNLKVDTCWFYPWKYQDREDVWKGLIAEVILATIDFEKVDTNKILVAAKQFGRFLGGSFVRVLSGLKMSAEVGKGAKAEFAIKDALTGIIEEYGKHVTPQEAYYNVFERTLEEWIGECYKKDKSRLVIFIDDLDRCLPGIALQVLEAIKLYLNVPNLVIVVGVDRQVIDAVVRKHYKDCLGDEVADEMGAKARQYLDKMFQVEVPISPRESQVKAYIRKHLPSAPIWSKISHEHQQIFRYIIEEIADINPRSVVRALNTAIVGAESETDELKVAQAMQRALITTVLQKLPEKEYGPVFDLCLREEGLQFFRKWSAIVVANPKRPHYLRLSELPSVGKAGSDDATLPIISMPGKRQVDSEEEKVEDLLLLAMEDEKYRFLLTVRSLGLLMGIPFAPSADMADTGTENKEASAWEELRAMVAERERVGVDQVTIEYLMSLTALYLGDTQVTDKGMEALKKLTELVVLDLTGTLVTDKSMKDLATLTGLTVLSLSDTRVTDKGVESFSAHTGLNFLYLSDTNVTDNGLKVLKTIPGLTTLDISGTQVSDKGVETLNSLAGLTTLNLSRTKVTDKGVKALEALKELTTLLLFDTQVTDQGVEVAKTLTKLRKLNLQGTQVTDKCKEDLRKSLKECTIY